MARIKFTGKHHTEDHMTVDKHYEVKAYSKRLDCYRVINDDGFEEWHYRDNFELVEGTE